MKALLRNFLEWIIGRWLRPEPDWQALRRTPRLRRTLLRRLARKLDGSHSRRPATSY